jgi:hypothetical protein
LLCDKVLVIIIFIFYGNNNFQKDNIIFNQFGTFIYFYPCKLNIMGQKYPAFLNYLILSIFIILSVIGILHHSMSLDEVNSWLLCKNSWSIPELIQLNRYQGNLGLWEYLLYALTRFTDNMAYMQWLNLAIAVLAAFLCLKYSPFSAAQKICILFSYFFLFEYTVVCRSYSLSWLFLVLFFILFTRKNRNYTVTTLILIFLANTHLLSLVTAVPLFIITLYTMRIEGIRAKMPILLSALFLVGMMVSLFNMMPPSDANDLRALNESYFSFDRISKASSYFVKGLYPLPDFLTLHFWNTNFIVVYVKPFSILLTAMIILIPFFLFYEKPLILLFYYASNFGIIFCLYILGIVSGVRYMGYCFMILLAALWLGTDERFTIETNFTKNRIPALANAKKALSKPFIWSVLITQLASGICAFCLTLHYPFSEGKNVALYLKNNLPLNSEVIEAKISSGPAIAAYLNKELYYPENNTYSESYQWTTIPKYITVNELTQRILTNISADSSDYKALVLTLDMDSLSYIENIIMSKLRTTKYSIFKKMDFNNGIVTGENYRIYFLKKV